VRSLGFSPAAFLVAYCCVYILALAFDLPLFRYYPLHGQFCWGSQHLANQGPAIVWYGIEADAGLLGALGGLLAGGFNDRRLSDLLWLVPASAMGVTVFMLRSLFW